MVPLIEVRGECPVGTSPSTWTVLKHEETHNRRVNEGGETCKRVSSRLLITRQKVLGSTTPNLRFGVTSDISSRSLPFSLGPEISLLVTGDGSLIKTRRSNVH